MEMRDGEEPRDTRQAEPTADVCEHTFARGDAHRTTRRSPSVRLFAHLSPARRHVITWLARAPSRARATIPGVPPDHQIERQARLPRAVLLSAP